LVIKETVTSLSWGLIIEVSLSNNSKLFAPFDGRNSAVSFSLWREIKRRIALGLIKTKKGYLFFAIVCFILSLYGFAGLLEGGSRDPNPVYFGFILFFSGVYFLYCYFEKR